MPKRYTLTLLALALLLALHAAGFRHYGDDTTANAGIAVGDFGFEYRGDPGFFTDTGK